MAEHISPILERCYDRLKKQRKNRSKMIQMQATTPRKLSIDFINGDEYHRFEVDVTGLEAEEIQSVCEDVVDEMLIHIGVLEVARCEQG